MRTMIHMPVRLLSVMAFSLAFGGVASAQDEPKPKDPPKTEVKKPGATKVFNTLSVEETEKLLKEMKIEFKRNQGPKEDTAYFDFKKGNFEIRLTNFAGKDLMLDCLFKPLPMDKVNEWNIRTKFSRVSLQKGKQNDITVLEWNLDLVGGVTNETVAQYFKQFETELVLYDKYISQSGGGAVSEKVLAKVDDAAVEKVLNSLNLKFEKKEDAARNLVAFDFEMNNFRVRLYNFEGKDLMLDAEFKAIPLAQANSYNLSRKFIRVVLYKMGGRAYTALECNLDCEAGVSESIIRNFVSAFADDVRNFSEFVKNQKE